MREVCLPAEAGSRGTRSAALRVQEMVTSVAECATGLDPSLDKAQVTVAMTRLEAI